jgi:RHS repeat-associated protein
MNPLRLFTVLLTLLSVSSIRAATFSSSRASVTDTSGGLSWNDAAGQKALTISCWFKISLPNGGTISQPMILMANTGATWTSPNFTGNHAYALFLNPNTGNVDFTAKGTAGTYSRTVIATPYLERWYHVAVVIGNGTCQSYVDGRKAVPDVFTAGNTSTTDGIHIGGNSNGYHFSGEIQEVQVFQSALNQAQIATNRFLDLNPASWSSLKGYFKLAYSTTTADQLKNFAAAPPTGTATLSADGTITFEETSKDGEQSLFDSRKNDGQSSISALSGSYSWSQTAIARPTPGIPFEFTFGYNSSTASNGYPLDDGDAFTPQALGAGWRHNFETRILPVQAFNPTGTRQAIGLMTWDGSVETWDLDVATASGIRFKTRSKEYRGELELIGSNLDAAATFRWITPDRLIYTFRTAYSVGQPEPLMMGRLIDISDFNGNRVLLTYHETGDKAGLLQSVTDTAGGLWSFHYDASNLLTSVTGPSDTAAQKWTVTFTYTQANGRSTLASKSLSGPAAYTNAVTPALSTQWQFQYAASSTNLATIIDPRGKNDTRITYDARGRKTQVQDALDRATTFAYNSPSLRQLTTSVSTRSVVDTFDRKLRRISSKNALNHTTAWEYDDFGNMTAMVDPRGTRSTYTYDARSNRLSATVVPLSLTSTWEYSHVLTLPGASTPTVPCNEATRITNPLNWPTNYSYDTRGNLLTQTDGLGTLVTHAYDAKGLVTSSTDANGNQTTFGYNGAGFLTSRTLAAGTAKASTATLVPSELGWLMSETNALSQTVTYTRNINGQAVRTTDPLGRQFVKAFDANGNLTSESDAKGATTTYAYNDGDERVSMTNRAGSTWTYTYNAWGEPATTTTPAALSDGTSRQETTTRNYDNAGRLTSETDTYGSSTSFEYDANGNQTAVIDKQSRRWEQAFDLLNRPITSKDPLGNITTTSYDAAGRVKTITSPNGHPTQHDYDGRGRLIKWTDPMGSDWLYTYDGNANILDIEDALHGHYLMTYGPANERLTERNQDNQTWTYLYDALFRLQTQTDPNGTTRTFVRDAAGRTERVDFGSGRTNSLTYDDNNNPLTVIRSQPGASATLNSLSYDSLDRLTSSTDTFGKTVSYTYDVLSRVVTKTYPGSKVLTHTYDRLHRLTGQSFNFGTSTFTTSFSYDAVGRLTQQTYPNGLSQVNSFDNAGRVTALDHRQDSTALIALTYAYDKNGNKTSGTNQGDVVWNPTNVTAYDETARFTPAGKLIDRVDSAPAVPKPLAYTYDASGNMTRAATPDNSEVYALAYDEDNRTTSLSYTTSLTTKTIVNRYDAMGRRVSRTADGIQTRYVLDLMGSMERILCDTNSSGTVTAWYVHSPAGLSYKVDTAGVLTCYHADAQGNIIRTTTTDGPDADTVPDTVNEYAYTPYGRRLVVTGPTGDPYRFVGSQGVMEELPNLYFMRARYYSAEAEVFLGTDPVKCYSGACSTNWFRYANSNPLSFVDSNGCDAELTLHCIQGEGDVGIAKVIYNQVAEKIGAVEFSTDVGHCWLEYQGSTYGTSQGHGLRVNFERDGARGTGAAYAPTHSLSQSIDGNQENVLMSELAQVWSQGSNAWSITQNCSTTAGTIFNKVTGQNLPNPGLDTPDRLSRSIQSANTKPATGIMGGEVSAKNGTGTTSTVSQSDQGRKNLSPLPDPGYKPPTSAPTSPIAAINQANKTNQSTTTKKILPTPVSSPKSPTTGPTKTAYNNGIDLKTGMVTYGPISFSIFQSRAPAKKK